MDSYTKLEESSRHHNLTTDKLNYLLSLVGSVEEDEAISQILASYQKLVLKVAQNLFAKVHGKIVGASLIDFVQQGSIGLWNAIITYNSTKGGFGPYARRGITFAIIRLIENVSGVIRKPARTHERWRRLQKQSDKSQEEEQELDCLNQIMNEDLIPFPLYDHFDESTLIENEFLLLVEKGLSKEHAEILKARIEGFSNTEIAQKLHLSRKTVITFMNDLKDSGTNLNDIGDKLARAVQAGTYKTCVSCNIKLKRDEWKYCKQCQREAVSNGKN